MSAGQSVPDNPHSDSLLRIPGCVRLTVSNQYAWVHGVGRKLPELGGKQLYPLSHPAGLSFNLLAIVFAYLSILNIVFLAFFFFMEPEYCVE